MKKILLSLVMMLGFIGYISAAEISYTMDQATLESTTVDGNNNPIITGFSYDVISASIDKKDASTDPCYSSSGKDVRIYAKSSITLSTTDGSNLTNIVFTISKNGKTRLTDMTVDTGTCVSNGADTWTVVWTGDAPEVTFVVGDTNTHGTDDDASKAGRLAFSGMSVTTGAGTGVEKSEMPVISPESCTFTEEGIAVTISAATGATIYYTLDDTTPTTESDVYTSPLAITTTTTVKAIAVEEGKEPSKVAEATYTYRSGSFTMSDVLATATEGNTYEVGGVVTALCTRGFIVTDNTGSMFVYYASGFDANEYKIGDQVSFSGTLGSYGQGLQFTGTDITVEKWDNVEYTYPKAMTYDWDTAITRTAAAKAMYVEMEGTLSISGNYYNVVLPNAKTAQGSIYYATDATKALMQNGQEVTLKGYFISISGGKYANIIVTEVTAEGDATESTKVANIAEFISKGLSDETTTFEITGEVAVTYQNGSNLYVADATGQILVYGTLNKEYKNGDRLTGIQGTFKNYYSTYEMNALSTSFGDATAGEEVKPTTIQTVENVTSEIQNHYVLLENVTLDSANTKFVDPIDAEIKYYNKFAIELPEDGVYNVIGVVNYYQAKGAEAPEVQIYPIEFLEAGTTPEPEVTEAATLAEALALGANGETGAITITGDVTIVYKNNRNIYIKDAETWSLIYNKTDVEMPAYKNGDIISNFKVTYALNDNQPQFLPVDGTFTEAKAGVEVEPIAINTTEVSAENYHKYVVLTNVDFAVIADKNNTGEATDTEGTATIYATWNNNYSDPKVELATDGKYDIKGFVSSYKGAYQVLVTEFAEPNAVESIVLDTPIVVSNGSIIAPQGAEIYNMNGVRINGNNVGNGIYVVKVGNAAVKVLVK